MKQCLRNIKWISKSPNYVYNMPIQGHIKINCHLYITDHEILLILWMYMYIWKTYIKLISINSGKEAMAQLSGEKKFISLYKSFEKFKILNRHMHLFIKNTCKLQRMEKYKT